MKRKENITLELNNTKNIIKEQFKDHILKEGEKKDNSEQWTFLKNNTVLRFSSVYPLTNTLKKNFVPMKKRHHIERVYWNKKHKENIKDKRFYFDSSELAKNQKKELKSTTNQWQNKIITPRIILSVIIIGIPFQQIDKTKNEIFIKKSLREQGYNFLSTNLRFLTFRYNYFIDEKNREVITKRIMDILKLKK